MTSPKFDLTAAVTSLMEKVEAFKVLVRQLEQIKGEIVTLQRELADRGVVINLPVVGSIAGLATSKLEGPEQAMEPVSPLRSHETSGYLIAQPLIPEREIFVEDVSEVADLSHPLPHGDKRTAEQISREVRVNPSPGEMERFNEALQHDFDRAFAFGMAEGERKKGRR